MRRMFLLLAALSLTAASAFAQPTYQPPAGRTLLRAGHVLDVHTGKETPDETIIIAGDKIVAIAATSATPAGPGDRVVDLTAYTLLPGLIDVHTHLTMAHQLRSLLRAHHDAREGSDHRRGEREDHPRCRLHDGAQRRRQRTSPT